jgi:hypothetical protein
VGGVTGDGRCDRRPRDAADVALTTSFGPSTLERFTVWMEELAA